ncbi:uncharacterized protein BP5553_02700 [Venustampulla echinocandica]|uniref:Uncharacterized protein n=1 Tax=Venustampulla echinocandica TaxID=2656787 RepID=A0A370TS52_9HELO|nr:uncharacterized protein BP5553_02700 [Venustampulla echinocandica]RDL38360.1 hypothetical protein BP5553_02700 [Venustampulla echinocandica]
MVKNLALIALLASLSLAAPTVRVLDTRSPEALNIGLGLDIDLNLSVSASVGFNANIAVALEACIAGVASGVIDVDAKLALLAWIQDGGSRFFNPSVCKEIISWCNGDSHYQLPAPVSTALTVALEVDVAISATGGYMPYFNSYIQKSHKDECACSVIPASPQASLLEFLHGSVGAALDIEIQAALQLCASGGIAATLSASSHASLLAWLEISVCPLEVELVALVRAWLSIGTGITLPSAPSHPDPSTSYVLDHQTQLELLAWIETSVFASLDVSIQASLYVCVSGGVSAALDVTALAALTTYVSGPNCELPATLQASIELWLSAYAGVGLEVGTAIDAYAYVNAGVDIEAEVDISGHLSTASSSNVSSFCSSHGEGLPTHVLDCLNHASQGGLAIDLEIEAAIALATFLADESCPLEATVRATLLVWLSIGGLKGVTLGADVIAVIKAAVDAGLAAELSSVVRGALGLAVNGQVAAVLSVAARAEVAAFLLVDVKIGAVLDVDVVASVCGWLSGVGISH